MQRQKMLKRENQETTARTHDKTDEEQIGSFAKPTASNSIVRMQQTVGNRSMQRMIANGQLFSPAKPRVHTLANTQAKNQLQARRSPNAGEHSDEGGGGTELTIQRKTDSVIQRGWFDDATDWVSDTAGDAADWVSDTAGDAADWVSDTAGDAADWVSDTAGDAADWVSDTAGDAADWVSDTASDAADWVSDTAGEAWEGIQSVGGEIWDRVSGGANAAWDALSDTAKAAWDGVVSAAQAVGGLADDAWERLKSLGEAAWLRLSAAGAAVWQGIRRFGDRAWDIISDIGIALWEKLCFYGDVLWSFVSNIPTRLWRLVIDAWDGVKGLASWLADGFTGFMSWLGSGLAGAASWAIDFLSNPSLEKLAQAVKQFVSWLGDGAIGALGWVWDGIKGGAQWALTVALHLLELLGLGEALSALWGTIFHLRPLMDSEIAASSSIHGAGQIPYGQIWVDEGSVFTKVNGGRAVTTMHILHVARPGAMSGDLAVHELTHVAQYQSAGAIYMAQAVHAQIAGSQYDYGDLTGKHFSDLDREAQAELCQDYYILGGDKAPATKSKTTLGGTTNTVAQFRPLIAEMRAGQY